MTKLIETSLENAMVVIPDLAKREGYHLLERGVTGTKFDDSNIDYEVNGEWVFRTTIRHSDTGIQSSRYFYVAS